jgi:hypothetical protein
MNETFGAFDSKANEGSFWVIHWVMSIGLEEIFTGQKTMQKLWTALIEELQMFIGGSDSNAVNHLFKYFSIGTWLEQV